MHDILRQPMCRMADTARVVLPQGLKVFVGGFPVTLRYDAIADVDSLHATFVKASLEREQDRG